MRNIGYILVTVGFLLGAYAAVEQKEVVNIPGYMVGLVGSILGVAMIRVSQHRESREEGRMSANIEAVKSCIERIAENAAKLDSEKNDIDVYDLRHRIDEIFLDDIQTFVDARESIAHRFGLNAYAEVMSHFASGERHINRVWSTSTDGYIDEAHTYLTKAAEQFRETREAFTRLAAA